LSRLGPLREREFRLLFLGRTVSTAGSAIAPVGLAFAVLDVTGRTADLGYVLAARALPTVLFILVGGIWADRLPRHLVMVGSNAVSAGTQATVAALLLTGHARFWHLLVLAAMNGASSAFFFPASVGLVPQTVSLAMLQRANVVLRLSLNATNIGGAALGGFLVAATSPGWAIAFDAATYFASALLFAMMRVGSVERLAGKDFIGELREGWREFRARTWLWAIVLQFGVVNAVANGSFNVIGPVIAKEHLNGASSWGVIVAAEGAGLILGGLFVLRRPTRRMLLAATIGVFPLGLPLVLLGLTAPTLVVATGALVAGAGIEVFAVNWDTTIQQEIPQDRLSRVSSWDALGSFALMPLGFAAMGPLAALLGNRETLLLSASLVVAATAPVLLSRDVRTLERRTSLPQDIAA
jgi:MFS family permease